ncbi:MAG: DUF1559 domain-containing protein [Pirellulales bacterium]|jgi:prepilin-type processing-associated H-X9-DG protein|nr:DUF1559 domain-containing protein [Pirellulales bacterium]
MIANRRAPSTPHPGGAHFLYGDGSVHFLQETIDLAIYQALSTKSGSEPVTGGP